MLLERETQLERLAALWAEAGQRRGHLVAVTGEAGAGKTTLVQAFIAGLPPGTPVHRGACEDLAIPEPLGPLHDLARSAHWPLGRTPDLHQRLAVFSQMLGVFEEGPSPSLLVIEDLHWADDPTLDFVRFLGRRIDTAPILLVVTARNESTFAQRRLRRGLADVPAANVARLDVPLLSESAVTAMARRAGREGGALYRATAGNAFFVTELLSDGSGDLPPNLRDTVLARADHLTAEARAVLDAVSVFPRRAEAEVLLAIGGPQGPDGLAECVAQGMLEETGKAYAFRHEIARQAIEAALPAPRRRALHAAVLAVLRAGTEPPMPRLVHHALEAQDDAAVRVFAPQAAAEAARVGAHCEAATHIAAALRQPEHFSEEERACLYEKYAFECHLIGRIGEAIRAQHEARALHKARGNTVKQGDCLRWLSRLNYLNGDRGAADADGEAAATLLETVEAGPELAMAYSNRSQLAMLCDDIGGARRHGERAITLARTLQRDDILSHALNNLGTAEQWFDAARARSCLDRSLALALDNNFQEHVARAYTNRGYLEMNLRRYEAAREVLETGIAYCVERDLDTWNLYMRGTLAELFLRQGRWDDAANAVLPVMNDDSAAPLVRFPAVMALARLRLRRGDPALGPLITEIEQFFERGKEFQRLALYAALKAEQAWLGQAQVGEALSLIEEAEGLAPTRAAAGELIVWRQILAPERDPGETQGLAEPHRLFVDGDWRGAAALWAEIGAPFERALALMPGDEAAQRTALALFEWLGARPFADRARGSMRRGTAGALVRRPRPPTLANPAGLTERQMAVLQLIVRGFSNKKIAASLKISPKTVDHHVSAVLDKLAAGSRGEATARALEEGLV